MGDIIRMSEATKSIPPKSSSHEHAGQRYTITYDPTARRWVWVVSFVQTFKFFGEGDTAEAASRNARRKIHNLTKDITEIEETNAR